MAVNIHQRAAVWTMSFHMVCFVQRKVKKCLIALPSPLIMKKIYPIEYIIILNQNFAEAEKINVCLCPCAGGNAMQLKVA